MLVPERLTRFDSGNICRIWFVFLFLIGPLYIPGGYELVLDNKTFIVYFGILICFTALICLLISGTVTRLRSSGEVPAQSFDVRGFFLSFDRLDAAVSVFALTAVLSTVFSGWPAEAFFGNACWYVGSLLIILLTFMYYICSRTFKREQFAFVLMFAGAVLTMLWGFLNELSVDVFGLLDRIDQYWTDVFISSLGNVDVYSAYLAVVIPVIAAVFTCTSDPVKRYLSGAGLFLGYLNVYLTHADSIYFSIAGVSLIYIWWCLRSPHRIECLSVNGMILGAAGITAGVIIRLDPELFLDQVTPILMHYGFPVIVFILSAAAMYLYRHFTAGMDKHDMLRLHMILSRVWLGIAGSICLLAAVFMVLHFDRDFFNRRGLLWEIALRSFAEGNLREKLIGTGPGTIDRFAVNYRHLIIRYYGDIYELEHAHNDLLEYLATTGLLGACAYLGIYIYVIANFVKQICTKQRYSQCFVYAFFGLAGYMVQSVINGPHPLMTACFFTLLAIYRSTVREDTDVML